MHLTFVTLNIQSLLSRVSAFQGLGPDGTEWLSQRAKLTSASSGEALWHAADPASSLAIISVGLLKTVQPTSRGSAICGIFGPPSCLGELSVVRRAPRMVDAVVISRSADLVLIPQEAVHEALERWPALGTSIAAAAFDKLRVLHDKIDILSSGSVPTRMARLMLHLYELVGDDLDDNTATVPIFLARQELADLVSTSLETTIRVMGHWREKGLVGTSRSGFEITDMRHLRDIAERSHRGAALSSYRKTDRQPDPLLSDPVLPGGEQPEPPSSSPSLRTAGSHDADVSSRGIAREIMRQHRRVEQWLDVIEGLSEPADAGADWVLKIRELLPVFARELAQHFSVEFASTDPHHRSDTFEAEHSELLVRFENAHALSMEVDADPNAVREALEAAIQALRDHEEKEDAFLSSGAADRSPALIR